MTDLSVQPDDALLREVARGASQEALGALVRRHINLVYSSALRQVRDAHLAEDVAQVVFLVLAKKAKTFREGTIPAAWLLKTTRLASLEALRRQARRQRHEQQAASMKPSSTSDEVESMWPEAGPLLDEGLSRLSRSDRAAIVMRYFENKSHRDVAAALGLSEEAARKRVWRAVESLRGFFASRGVNASTASVAAALGSYAVLPAPVAVAATVSASVAAGTVAASTTAAAKGVIAIMALSKIKTAAVGLVSILMVGGGVYAVKELAQEPPRRQPIVLAPAASKPAPKPNVSIRNDNVMARNPAARKKAIELYSLKPGEHIKRVGPPFIPEREALSMQAYSLAGEGLMVLEQDKEPSARSQHWGIDAFSVEHVLLSIVRMSSWEYELPAELSNLKFKGDWVVRKDVTKDELVRSLAEFLSKEVGRTVSVEKDVAERDVVIAKGRYEFRPLLEKKEKIIYIGAREGARPERYGRSIGNDVDALLKDIGHRLRRAVFNESEPSRERGIVWTADSTGDLRKMEAGAEYEKAIEQVLAMVSKQTGLTFEKGRRPIEVWIFKVE